MRDTLRVRVSSHARVRIGERVPNIGTRKSIRIFEEALRHGYNVRDFYGRLRKYLTKIFYSKEKKCLIKVYDGIIYLHAVTEGVDTLITVLNIPENCTPWKDYLICNRNNPHIQQRIQEKENQEIKKKEEINLQKISRKEMLKWTQEQLKAWREAAYKDEKNHYLECAYCNEYLDVTHFSKDRSETSRTGFRPECKQCNKIVKEYGGIKKIRNDGVTILDLKNRNKKVVSTEKTTKEKATKEKPKIKVSEQLKDKTIKCRDCGNDFTFSWGEQVYYYQHKYIEPTRCPQCREKAKIKDTQTCDLDSNSLIVVEQAKQLLITLKRNDITLEQFESILQVYNNSNSFALNIARSFQDLVLDEQTQPSVKVVQETYKIKSE